MNNKNYYIVNTQLGMVKGPYSTLKQAIKEAHFWSTLEQVEYKIMIKVADDGAL